MCEFVVLYGPTIIMLENLHEFDVWSWQLLVKVRLGAVRRDRFLDSLLSWDTESRSFWVSLLDRGEECVHLAVGRQLARTAGRTVGSLGQLSQLLGWCQTAGVGGTRD